MSDSENRMLDAATPRPWFIENLTAMDLYRSRIILMVGDSDQDRADLALVVEAVNEREALRAALATAQDALDATPPHKRAWRFDVQRLEAALVTAETERDAAHVDFNAWEEERDRADAEEDRAVAAEARVAALTDYVKHKPDCAPERGFADQPCDCGLAALLVGEPDPETTT